MAPRCPGPLSNMIINQQDPKMVIAQMIWMILQFGAVSESVVSASTTETMPYSMPKMKTV